MPNPSKTRQDHCVDEGGQGCSVSSRFLSPSDRRTFLELAAATAAAGAATLAWPTWARSAAAASDMDTIRAEIEKRHDESVKRLQDWIRPSSIAAENRGMNGSCELTMRMLRDADFHEATKVP